MKRILYYDVLNILACFGVIAIHSNGLVNDYANAQFGDWLQALAINIVFMAAVPLFFMLSGATLLDYRGRMQTAEFLGKRLLRTVLPFIIWSLIAFAWALRSGYLPASPQEFINGILSARYMAPYWFFLPLFAVYLAMPVLSRLVQDRWSLRYLALAGTLTVFVLPPTLSLLGINWNHFLVFPLTGGGYLVYVLVGYLLATAELSRSRRWLIYGLGFGSIVFAYLATVFLTVADGAPNHAFWEYLYWPSLGFSSAVFLLFKQIRWSRWLASKRSQRILAKVASCSLGIYLIHAYGISAVIRLTGYGEGDLAFRLLAPFAVYLGGLLVVLLLKQIPLLRRLVP